MKPVSKLRFTELGAIALAAMLVFFGSTFFFDQAAFEQSAVGKLIMGALAIPAVFGVFLVVYCVGHAASNGRWRWFFGCWFFWPLALLYWWQYIRPVLAHDAQQRAPADSARAARSLRG